LSVSCVNCSTINTFKKRLSSELESEAVRVKFKRVSYTAKACAYLCQRRLWRHAGVGEFGELYPVKVMLVDLYCMLQSVKRRRVYHVWDVFHVLLLLGRTFMFGLRTKN